MMIKKFNENWDTYDDYVKSSQNKIEYEVIGLPSGQVLFLDARQITYFKEREYIRYIKTWKKPISGGFLPIKIERYCFEDTEYKTIMELINAISW